MAVSKRWVARSIDESAVASLCKKLPLSTLLAKMLVARGITSEDQASLFFRTSLKNLKEPLLFKDMDKAVQRIARAIVNHEKIGIFGDYDVDGVCATAILEQFFRSIHADVVTTLPNRMTEGYGLSQAGIDRLKAQHASLLITADCGILAHDQIDYAISVGFDVIVVDHHTVGETLPRALAVINPKRSDCESNAPYLCAAGVAFFLCMAVRRRLREDGFFSELSEPDVRELLDLVALATVCDVVPLVHDNRCLVSAGLKMIRHGARVGLSALIEACGIDKEKLSSTNLGFHLGPRINAAGRLDDATLSLKLLLCHNVEEARHLASMLDETNLERRAIEEETVKEACRLIDEGNQTEALVLVLQQEHWHPGVVGIVASRIAERYHRPAIIIGEKGKGSGRSIKGIDLHAMVLQASQSLAGFGGHAHAIGVALGPGGVEVFRNDLLAIMQAQIPTTVFNRELYYDAEVALADINLGVIDELAQLEPFGAHNPYPVVRINRCSMRNLRRLGGGHLKGELEHERGCLSFIGFRMDIDDRLAHAKLDILGILEKNEWQGRVIAQVRLIDFKSSEVGD